MKVRFNKDELINRYKQQYLIPEDVIITYEEVVRVTSE